ncbi:MAG: DUF3467 domain-containing protein [Dehalococcoidia bacterium]
MAEEQKESLEHEVPIRIEGFDEVPITHVNHIFVVHTTDEFFITFAQLHPPYWVEPTKEEMEQLTHLSAKVVARIALSPGKMKELIDVLNKNYQKFTRKKEGV